MRFSPDTTGTLPSTYVWGRRRTRRGPSCSSWTSAMKASTSRVRATSPFVRDAGTTASVWRAREAFRTRVSMPGVGSEMFIGVTARLRDARQLALEGALPEADPAQGEPSHVGPRATADEAAV